MTNREDRSVPPTVIGSLDSSYPDAESLPPRNSGDNPYGFDTGGIVSYVVPTPDSERNIVDAVAVVPEEQILEQDAKKKRLFFVTGICLAVLIVLVVIAVVVVAMTGRGTNETIIVPDTQGTPNPVSNASTTPPTATGTIETKAFEEFIGVLESYYDGNVGVFADTSSPQYRAAAWTVESASPIMDDDRMIRRFALATFYFETNGNDWVRCGRDSKQCDLSREWLTEENECNWYAIKCDEDGAITEIYFPSNADTSNNVRGNLPLELSFLSKLAIFIIAQGPMSGPFPDWSKLSTLEQVLLNGNEFDGPFPTYLLPNNPLIGTIQFNGNNFEGPFLQDLWLSTPIGVTNIELNGNKLSGSIPSQISNLSSLKILDIGSNGFTGILPKEFYELTNLVSVNLSDTSVSGKISTNISAMSKLHEFHAGRTGMSGTLPTQLFSLNQLRKLDLGFASFTGSLSESFSALTNLDFIKLDHNGFAGTIPPGFENLPFLENLELHDNDLTGSVPQELCDRRGEGFMDLRVLTVDCNGEFSKVSCQCCTNCPRGT